MRAEGTEVGGPEVVVAHQLELVLLRLVRAHTAVGRLTNGLTGLRASLGFRLAGRQVVDVFVSGRRMRVMPCRVLTHH
jgi:hypothetical protein